MEKNPYFKVYSSDWDARHSSAPQGAAEKRKEKEKKSVAWTQNNSLFNFIWKFTSTRSHKFCLKEESF